MEKIITASLVLVGIIHLLPVSGIMGAERISSLYDVEIADPNLLILMRHRAVLFGVIGLFFLYAAFKPSLQPMAILAGFLCVVPFLAIAWTTGEYNDAVRKVFLVDVVALLALCVAGVLYISGRQLS